jgi:hypothetical protein
MYLSFALPINTASSHTRFRSSMPFSHAALTSAALGQSSAKDVASAARATGGIRAKKIQ